MRDRQADTEGVEFGRTWAGLGPDVGLGFFIGNVEAGVGMRLNSVEAFPASGSYPRSVQQCFL